MKFTILIDSSDRVFADAPESELSTILDTVKTRLADGLSWMGKADSASGDIRDSNGNKVGTWAYMPDRD